LKTAGKEDSTGSRSRQIQQNSKIELAAFIHNFKCKSDSLLGSFVRSRIQHTYHISDVALARVGETLFVNNTSGAGETTEVSLERSLDNKTLLRWANTGTVSRESRGLEWVTDLTLINELSSLSAITVAGSIFGNTNLDDVISNYRILARYRRNFLRSWLFYELEPEISWLRRGNGAFPARIAITFLLEVVFRGMGHNSP
jgi:hypothetical protein